MANESLEHRTAKSEIIPLSEEIKRVLDVAELWDHNFPFIEVGQSYRRRRWEHAWQKFWEYKKVELGASAAVAVLTAIVTGSTWTSALSGAGAGLIAFFGILLFIFIAFLFAAPREMDAALRGKLDVTVLQLREEQKKLQRVASIAVSDHERYIDSLRADLKGAAAQVYIDDLTIDEESICFFVTIQLDLWNIRTNAAIIQNFSIMVYSSLGVLQGNHVSLYGITYSEANRSGSPKVVEIDEYELPKSPPPDGYLAGRPEFGKWLRFRVDGVDFDQVKSGTHLRDYVNGVDLLIADGENALHVVSFQPPWIQRGTIENTFGSQRISDEDVHAILAETHNLLSRELQKCREGVAPNDHLIHIYLNMASDVLRRWQGVGYETEFNQCPDRASEEMNSWTPERRKSGMFLYARIEKLAEYMREIRAHR